MKNNRDKKNEGNVNAGIVPVSAVRRPRVNAPLLLLLCGIGLFHYLTMPNFMYRGDNLAPRAECAYWLSTGQ